MMHKIYLNVKKKPILIEGKPTNYEILSCGWVYNLRTGKFMKGGRDKNGYHIISLSLNGRKYTRKVHRLVAEAFIPNPKNLPEIDHVDTNKWNNDVSNLEWVTSADNTHRAIANGLRYGLLDETMAKAICILLQDGSIRISDISRVTGVSQPAIVKIKNGINWRDISEKYDFSNYKFGHGSSGEKNPNSKLTTKTVIEIKSLLRSGMTVTEVSKKLGVSVRAVSCIRSGQTWKHVI